LRQATGGRGTWHFPREGIRITAVASRKYKNSPIDEALTEVVFAPGEEWDPTWSLRVYDGLRSEYTGKPREQSVLEAGVHAAPSAASFRLQQRATRLQFPTDDGRRLVAVGPNVLSVHSLKPYEGWDSFRPRIARALGIYGETVRPKGVLRIGLRYINRILIPGSVINLADYFDAGIQLPATLPVLQVHFLSRAELLCEDEKTKIVITFTDTPASEGKNGFLLDLDVIREWPASEPLPQADTMGVIDVLKTRVRDAFEALITDKTRGIFDADPVSTGS
jgi:uncharacterized protein (TIGR04255 family)